MKVRSFTCHITANIIQMMSAHDTIKRDVMGNECNITCCGDMESMKAHIMATKKIK